MKEQATSPNVISPLALIGILSLSLVVLFGSMWWNTTRASNKKQLACTNDARVCSDGTVVGRSGSSCEFVCPTVVAESDIKMQIIASGISSKLQRVGLEFNRIATNVNELREIYHTLYDEVCYADVMYVKKCEGEVMPVIDWQNEVVAVIASTYGTSGNELSLESLSWAGKKPVIHYAAIKPGRSCVTTAQVNTPFRIIKMKLPKSVIEEYGYTFKEKELTKDCMMQLAK